MRALVTGGTGFVGGHVVRMLLRQGAEVRVLVRPTSDATMLDGLSVEPVRGELTDAASLQQAVKGMDLLFHVAADYRFWVPDPDRMQAVNVEGTVRLLRAAAEAGVQRMVYTSSCVTVRCSANVRGTERDFVQPHECRSVYQRTKVLAEQSVWQMIRQGVPITVVNPTTPIGALDRRPTPTGRLIVDYLNGRLPAFVHAVFNWVDVEDVATGHWLAATRGRVAERYILGHQNLSLGAFLAILAEVSQRSAPRIKIPYVVAYLAGACGNTWGRISRREPRTTLDGVRMAGWPMRYDSGKAVSELGLPQTCLRAAVEKAVRWYRSWIRHGRRSPMKIGLVAEVKWEVREVCRRLKLTLLDARDEIWGATMNGHVVRLCLSGMIPSISRDRVDRFLDSSQLDLMICSGLAGALRPNISVGEIIVQSEDALLIEVAAQALTENRLPFHVGSLVTVARPVLTPSARQELAATSGAIAVDMESQTIAALCRQRGIPCLAMKGVSDSMEDDLAPILDGYDVIQIPRIALRVLSRPGTWRLAARLARHSNVAARNLGHGVWATLGRLGSSPHSSIPSATS